MDFTNEQLELIGISPESYNELTQEEKELVNETISAMVKGDSSLYDELYYTDYQEIPVSFEQFITDDRYLGKSTRNGEFLYDFWKQECPKIVNSSCVEVALSGAIGIGKTTVADLMIAYILYKTMCMKDPQAFFNLSPGSNIKVAFLNNTLASSQSVGYETFMSFLRESPWFLDHGKLNRDGTELILERGFGVLVGSKPQHSLGQHVICVTGDTVIQTDKGSYPISELENQLIKVKTYDNINKEIVDSEECTVKQTGSATELYEIELEDGSIIKCTPEHRWMLKDGTYKMAKDLSEDDELMDIN